MVKKPNVILFLADDLGYGDLGCHGNTVVKTPHLDAFATDSVEVDRFYVTPVCAPTRAAMITGRDNFRTGVTDVFGEGCEMADDEITLAHILKDAGYATGLFGKWHLGDKPEQSPIHRGFDEALTFHGCAMKPDQYFDPTLLHNDVPTDYKGYCLDIFTDAAIEFMTEHKDEPFFIFLPSNLIHTPLIAPDDIIAQYDNLGLIESTRKTYAMIQNLDDNFGRLRQAVVDLGLDENTILMATSDNGPCSGSKPIERHMAGLHGLKGTVYENGIRVPFFFRWPEGGCVSGKREKIGAHIDLLPTIAEACGASLPDRTIDGINLLPMLKDPDTTMGSRNLFFQWDSEHIPRRGHAYCVVSQQWKLVQPCGMDADVQQHIRNRYVQLCELQGRGERSIDGSPTKLELYNLLSDPGERDDVSDQYPEIVESMRVAYDDWFTEVTARFF